MDTRDTLLEKLRGMLRWKKSRAYYAERLGISEKQVQELFEELQDKEPAATEEFKGSFQFEESPSAGTATVETQVDREIKSLQDLIEVCKIDTSRWEIDRYVQNFWGNKDTPYWQVKAWLCAKDPVKTFQESFSDFLSHYRPAHAPLRPIQSDHTNACLVLNKQDAHYNKYDTGGDNNIQQRFSTVHRKIQQILLHATMGNNLEKVIYVVGSDEFNSEWMNTTTKGTPQTNLVDYHQGFELICNHEVSIINELLSYSAQVEVLYIPGNHDEYVGWHLVNWLKAYYRNQPNIHFDTEPSYTKPFLYSNTAMLFNHGDVQKPEKLAQNFPIVHKDIFTRADHYYIFVGDKHHLLAKDIASIQFFQIPSLSKAKSQWDHRQGHEATRPEMLAFLIEEGVGMTNIFKKPL